MITTSRLPSILVACALGGALVACGAGDDGPSGTNDGATGGTPGGGGTDGADGGTGGTSSGGTVSSGGSSTGTGGSGGGTGTGGGNGTAFECPAGFEGQTPTLPANAGTPIEAPAVTGENRFLEGPVWDGSYLYVSQLRDYGGPAPARILRLEGGSLVEFIADEHAGTNGLAIRGDGKLVGASQRVNGLLLLDPAMPTAEPTVIVNEYMGAGFNSPNDLALRSDGNIYFTDPSYQCGDNCPQGDGAGEKRIYRVTPGGDVVATSSPYDQPNGIALSLDETVLFVAGNGSGLTAYELAEDGTVGASSTFANGAPPGAVSSVDGMTLDCAGNLYVTEHTAGRVVVFSPDQEYIGQIQVGANVTNVAFGGTERKTLYITTYSSALYAVELDIPGLPY